MRNVAAQDYCPGKFKLHNVNYITVSLKMWNDTNPEKWKSNREDVKRGNNSRSQIHFPLKELASA